MTSCGTTARTSKGHSPTRNCSDRTNRMRHLHLMNAHRSLSCGIGLLLFSVATAQNTGTLRLLVDPGHNFEFVVDKKHRMQQREVKLTEGLHHFSFWAPERVIVDTSVFVIADRTSDLSLRLPYSAEYMAYRNELGQFQARRRWTRTAPLLAVAGGAVWTIVSVARYGTAMDVLEQDRELYDINVDPQAIRTLKETTIPAHNEDMKKARTMVYASAGFTVLSGAAYYYVSRLTSKWERPLFDDKEKVKFDGLAWMPGVSGGVYTAGLTIQLSRP